MVPVLENAIAEWSHVQGSFAEIIRKGQNPLPEHYSAVKAEVVTDDSHTQVNEDLVQDLLAYDYVYVAGEALSHCLANTVRDMIRYDIDPKKIIILEDCTSNVTGFEELGASFNLEMELIGVRFMITLEVEFE